MLDHFSDMFGLLFWHLSMRSFLKLFWLIFDHPHPQKHCPCQCFWRFLHLLHDRSWNRSWTDFGSILESKIDSKSCPKRLENVSNFIVDFESHPGPPKINFWANITPTWPSLGLKIEPKWNPNFYPNRSQNGSREPKWLPDPPGSNLGWFVGRFWLKFCRLLIDFDSILTGFPASQWIMEKLGSSRSTPLNTALTAFEARG